MGYRVTIHGFIVECDTAAEVIQLIASKAQKPTLTIESGTPARPASSAPTVFIRECKSCAGPVLDRHPNSQYCLTCRPIRPTSGIEEDDDDDLEDVEDEDDEDDAGSVPAYKRPCRKCGKSIVGRHYASLYCLACKPTSHHADAYRPKSARPLRELPKLKTWSRKLVKPEERPDGTVNLKRAEQLVGVGDESLKRVYRYGHLNGVIDRETGRLWLDKQDLLRVARERGWVRENGTASVDDPKQPPPAVATAPVPAPADKVFCSTVWCHEEFEPNQLLCKKCHSYRPKRTS